MSLTRGLADAASTEALGAELALFARPGLLIRLEGDLGAGKTTLARGFLRALSGDQALDVPSPTFTLVQTYEQGRVPATHVDLYRLTSAAETAELALDDLLADHLLIVEWPEKLPPGLAADQVTVALETGGGGRIARLSGLGGGAQIVERLGAIAGFLADPAWSHLERRFLEGDASFRRYERLVAETTSHVLMDMAARPDGPPVKNGLPYSQIAHLAESIAAVTAVNGHLCALGYSAPRLLKADLDRGLAIIEDLGDRVYGRMMQAGEDMREPQATAVRLLADMAARDWPAEAESAPGRIHRLTPYDAGALTIETELLIDWYWPHVRGGPVPEEARDGFARAWATLLPLAEPRRRIWTLRDYHSPNLLWLPERQGLARVGLIDTQDCVLGHPAYDLVSMLQDARVTIPAETETVLLDLYCAERRGAADFSEADFRASYALLGAQRATKILGIFARLNRRDGKPGYLKHMPRVAAYLRRDLQHPALGPLARWYHAHLPEIMSG